MPRHLALFTYLLIPDHIYTHSSRNLKHRALRDLLLAFLTTALGVDPARLALQLTPTDPDDDPTTRYTAEATITGAEDPTSVSAYQAASQFLLLWAAPYSAQAAGLDPAAVRLDEQVQPLVRYVSPAPTPPTQEDQGAAAEPEEQQPITQGLDVSGPPEIAPPVPFDMSDPPRVGNKGRAALQVVEEGERAHPTSGPRATLLVVGAALVAVLALGGVYVVRRHGEARGRSRVRMVTDDV